jgi:hypothetical protein
MTTTPTASGIAPGDLGFTHATDLVGRIIEVFTISSYCHALVFHELECVHADGTEQWSTVESRPDRSKALAGPRYRTRLVDPSAPAVERRALKVVRVWTNPVQQAAIVAASNAIANDGRPYGWGTITAIALRVFGFPVRAFGRGLICSEHAFISAMAGRPELMGYLCDLVDVVDPGALAEACDAMTAVDRGDAGARAA